MRRKIISLVLSFGLLLQQISFAQVAAELNIANLFSKIGSNIAQDKFRPEHLRYFSYDSLNDNFKVLLDKGDLKNLKTPELESSTRTLLSYFLIGVTLPDDVFWVNLRPDSEDQIINPYLGKTDVGKIMLEADLQLKKDTATFTSPQTPEGKAYWDKLYQKASEIYGYENVNVPTLTRPWIVPGEIIVRESQDSAYVYKATLKVMLEQDYLKDSSAYNFKDPRAQELNEYSSQLIRELIIPKLTKEVNSSKRYAALRQVYYSLILSRWFKLRFTGKTGTYASLINTKDLSTLLSQKSWSKTDYFKQYQKSFAKGEYNIQEPTATPTGQFIRSYFSGGINVADGAINTQNGIILNNDNVAKLGQLDGGKANLDPQKITLKPVSAANLEGSFLDNYNKDNAKAKLAASWTAFHADNPQNVEDPTIDAYMGKVVREPIGDIFFKEFNKGRKKNEAKDEPIDTVVPPENNGKDRLSTGLEKVANNAVLVGVRKFHESRNIAGVEVFPARNPAPIGIGHLLFLFGKVRQLLNEDAIKVALTQISESVYGEHLKIGFNSWGAWASQNRLHLQSLFYPIKGEPSEMPVEKFDKKEIIIRNGITISELIDYPVRAFAFTGSDLKALKTEVFNAVKILQNEDIGVLPGKKGVAHNLIFTKTKNNEVCVYLFPRQFQKLSEFRGRVESRTGFAFLELGGEIVLKEEESYNEISEADVISELQKVSLNEEQFNNLKGKLGFDGGSLLAGMEEKIKKDAVADNLARLWEAFPEKNELYKSLFDQFGAANAYSEYNKSIQRAGKRFITQYFPYSPNFDNVKPPQPLEGEDVLIKTEDRQFTQAFKKGVIRRPWAPYLSPVNIAGTSVTPIDAPKPYGPEHIVLAIEMKNNRPQLLTESAIKVALTLIGGSVHGEHLKIGFNGAGAWASQDQLHLQEIFFVGKNGKPSEMPVESFKPEPVIVKDGITISILKDYPVKAFVFEGKDIEKLTQILFSAVKVLQEEKITVSEIGKRFEGFKEFYEKNSDGTYLIKGLPHNLIFTKKADNTLRVYLFPRQLQNEGEKLFGIGAAFVELGGTLLVWNSNLYERIKKIGVDNAATKVLEGIKLSDKYFNDLSRKIIGFYPLTNIRRDFIEDSLSKFWTDFEYQKALYRGTDFDTYEKFRGGNRLVRDKSFFAQYVPAKPDIKAEELKDWISKTQVEEELKEKITSKKQFTRAWDYYDGKDGKDNWQIYLTPQEVNGVLVTPFNAPMPYGPGHLVLLPELHKNLPQQLTREAINAALQLINDSDYSEHLKIGFNRRDAFASQNQLHLQTIFFKDQNQNPSRLPVEEFADNINNKMTLGAKNGVTLSIMTNYPVPPFIFQGKDVNEVTDAVYAAIAILDKTPLKDKLGDLDYIPHNVIFTKTEDGQLRVFVFPRKKQSNVEPYFIGAAFVELGGVLLVSNPNPAVAQDRFAKIKNEGIDKVLRNELWRIHLDPIDASYVETEFSQLFKSPSAKQQKDGGFRLAKIRKADILKTCSEFWEKCTKSLFILYGKTDLYTRANSGNLYETILKATEKYKDNESGTFMVQFLSYAPNMGDATWQAAMDDKVTHNRQLLAGLNFFSGSDYAGQEWNTFIYSQIIGGVSITPFNAPKPYAPGHLVLTPELEKNLPQELTENAVRVSLHLLSESDYNEHMKIGFNGQQAFASISQLHVQSIFFEDKDGNPAEMPVEKADTELFKDADGVKIFELLNYPAKGFVFEGNNIEKLTKAVISAVSVLKETQLKDKDLGDLDFIPHNLVFTKTRDEQLRVFLFPRKNQSKSPDYQIGAAFLELSGVLQVGKKEILDGILKEGIDNVTSKELRRIQLDSADFNKLRGRLSQLFKTQPAVAKPDGGYGSDFVVPVNKLPLKSTVTYRDSWETTTGNIFPKIEDQQKISQWIQNSGEFITGLQVEIDWELDRDSERVYEVNISVYLVNLEGEMVQKIGGTTSRWIGGLDPVIGPLEDAIFTPPQKDGGLVNLDPFNLKAEDANNWDEIQRKLTDEVTVFSLYPRIRGSKLELNDKRDLINTIEELKEKSKGYFEKSRKDNPLSHSFIVLDIALRIAFAKNLDYKQIRILTALAILHDLGYGELAEGEGRVRSKEIQQMIDNKKDKAEITNKIMDSIKARKAHMEKGVPITRDLLGQLSLENKFDENDIEEICRLVGIHDNPGIAKTFETYSAYLEDIKDSPKNYLISRDDKLASIFREADRLWMLSYEGLMADLMNSLQKYLKSQKDEDKPLSVDKQLANNLKVFTDEMKSYRTAGKDAEGKDYGPFFGGTFLRTLTGLKIYQEYRDAWQKLIDDHVQVTQPKKDGGSIPENTGGIDFRALPLTVQPMGTFSNLNYNLPRLSQAQLERIDVDSEMQQIKDLVRSGIAPSGGRIKELIAACIQKKEMSSQADNLLVCLADIFKQEEENASESTPELKEALALANSL